MKQPEKLVSLLHKTVEKKTAPHVPLVTRKLYELDPSQPVESVLDDLIGEKGFRQRSSAAAPADVHRKLPTLPRSNILRFSCRNGYIGPSDFFNLQPIPRERIYSYKPPLHRGVNFSMVKARHPLTLLFSGAYYLLFPNHFHACCYYMETSDRVVNGYPLTLEFVNPTPNHLKLMGSPLLEPGSNYLARGRFSHTTDTSSNIDSIYAVSPEKSALFSYLLSLTFPDPDTLTLDPHPSHDSLKRFCNSTSRSRSVLVRNLPFGLSRDSLCHLLWDYNFHSPHDPSASWSDIICDPYTQTHLSVIHFGDQESARRFVRNYHGRRWEKLSNEKLLYQPILCELLE